MTIRPATHADLDVLMAMARHFLAESPTHGPLVGPVLDFQLEWFIDDVLARGVILLADHEGEAVGLIALHVGSTPINGRPYGSEICWWVEPTCRHLAIGRELLQAAEAWAVARQLSLLEMRAPADSAIGPFYERCGYAPVETAYQKALVP